MIDTRVVIELVKMPNDIQEVVMIFPFKERMISTISPIDVATCFMLLKFQK